MSMKSLELADLLAKLPDRPDGHYKTSREHLSDLRHSKPELLAAESATAASISLWSIFDEVNVDDSIQAAYKAAYPREAPQHSLYEKVQELTERDEESYGKFINGIKGKMAEFNAKERLEQTGYTDVAIAPNPTQEGFDITATAPDGTPELWQVKTGKESYSYKVSGKMADNDDVNFAVSSEIESVIADRDPEAAAGLLNIGADFELVNGIDDGLDTLTDNLGIDIPDGLGEILPYAGAIMASIRLLHSVATTETTFKEADRTTKNKIQVVQTLTLISRMGLATLLSTAGGSAGSAIGTVVPGVGNLVGGIAGTITGGVSAMLLNKHIQPRALSLALDICGLEEDDLFYYKNKGRIDSLALSFHVRANTVQTALPSI